MPENQAPPMRQRRGMSAWRVVLGVLVGLIAGWIAWVWLADVLEVQPLYRLRDLDLNKTSVVRVAGPWLSVNEYTDNGRQIQKYYRLADGQLIRQIETAAREPDYFDFAIDHPEMGPETLIGHRRSPNLFWEVVLLQPHTGEERIIYRWNRNETAIHLWPNGKNIMVTRYLPLTPLFALGFSGLPDMVTTGFYNYLGYGDFNYAAAFKMTLVQVISSRDGQLLSSCALPCQVGVHVKAIPINEGKQLLVSCMTNDNRLRDYFVARSTAEEEQPRLASMFPPLAIMDCQSGRIIKAWPGLGQCSLDQIDDHIFFHRSNEIKPVQHWAQSRPSNLRFRVLDTRAQTLVELKRPEASYTEAATHHNSGYLLHSYRYVQDASQPGVISTTIMVTGFDKKGVVLTEKSLELQGGANAQLIAGQRQFIVNQDTLRPWHERWRGWVKQWPWLRYLHRPYSSRVWVWDSGTGEEHLIITSRLNMYEATRDGKYLLVGHGDSDNNITELSVYALPFPPHRWWAIWGPRVAGVLVVMVVLLVVVRVIPGHHRGSVPERISSS